MERETSKRQPMSTNRAPGETQFLDHWDKLCLVDTTISNDTLACAYIYIYMYST